MIQKTYCLAGAKRVEQLRANLRSNSALWRKQKRVLLLLSTFGRKPNISQPSLTHLAKSCIHSSHDYPKSPHLYSREMQRGTYHPPPAHSPPLHHPVPQHVSTVPMMRSPPPPQGYSNSPYGGQMGGQSQPHQNAGGAFAPAFGGFMNDQTAQMGFQVGQKAVMAGQEYMEQSVSAITPNPPLFFTH